MHFSLLTNFLNQILIFINSLILNFPHIFLCETENSTPEKITLNRKSESNYCSINLCHLMTTKQAQLIQIETNRNCIIVLVDCS